MAKQQDPLDTPFWSHRNVLIIIGFIAGAIIQTLTLYFMLSQTIHDEISNRLADSRVYEEKFHAIDFRLQQLESKPTSSKNDQLPGGRPIFEAITPEAPPKIKTAKVI